MSVSALRSRQTGSIVRVHLRRRFRIVPEIAQLLIERQELIADFVEASNTDVRLF
jgi:hypothetical protein